MGCRFIGRKGSTFLSTVQKLLKIFSKIKRYSNSYTKNCYIFKYLF